MRDPLKTTKFDMQLLAPPDRNTPRRVLGIERKLQSETYRKSFKLQKWPTPQVSRPWQHELHSLAQALRKERESEALNFSHARWKCFKEIL